VKRYGINVRPDSTQAELAVACARHFEDVRVSSVRCSDCCSPAMLQLVLNLQFDVHLAGQPRAMCHRQLPRQASDPSCSTPSAGTAVYTPVTAHSAALIAAADILCFALSCLQLDAEEAAAAEADSAFEEPPAPVHSKAAVNGSATKKMKAKSKQKGHGEPA
jgi:Sin3 binding region of histone deacetylase complex subunit SAP30